MVGERTNSILQQVLRRTIHVDKSVTAHLYLGKDLQLKEFVAPGAGQINSNSMSAVDNVHVSVKVLNVVLSISTE